jgi:hypothetical protein
MRAFLKDVLANANHREIQAVAETVEGIAQELQREALRLKRLSRGESKGD